MLSGAISASSKDPQMAPALRNQYRRNGSSLAAAAASPAESAATASGILPKNRYEKMSVDQHSVVSGSFGEEARPMPSRATSTEWPRSSDMRAENAAMPNVATLGCHSSLSSSKKLSTQPRCSERNRTKA